MSIETESLVFNDVKMESARQIERCTARLIDLVQLCL